MTYVRFLTIILLSLMTFATLQAQEVQEPEREPAEKDVFEIYDEVIMERITVVGAPAWMSRIPGAANYIGSKELEEQNYTDINRVLRSVSGVNIREEDGYGLRPNIGLRGSGVERSSKITLMEDGVLIAPAPYTAPAAYYIPSMGRMSSVEVRKGSSQVKYGPNTTGGVINMISTRIPYELSGQVEMSVGEHNSQKLYAHIGNSYDHVGFLIESLQMYNDGFKRLDSGGSTGFDVKDVMGKLMFRTNSDAPVFQKIEFKVGYYDEISDETYLGLTDSDFMVDPVRRYSASQTDQMNADHRQYQIRHFAMFGDQVDLTTTFYRNEYSRNWYKLNTIFGVGIHSILDQTDTYSAAFDIVQGTDSNPGDISVKANNREYSSQGVQTMLNFNLQLGSIDHRIEIGARYHQDQMDRFQWEDGYQMLKNKMLLTHPGTPGTESNRVESASALALYIQDSVNYEKWTFTPGVRYEQIDLASENYGIDDPERQGDNLQSNNNSLDVIVPGIGIVYQVMDPFDLFAGIHKGYAPPSPGSPGETDAENSINYEVGGRYVNDSLQAELIGFFNNYSNLLGTDLAAGGGTGTSRQFNGGSVLVAGIEFSYRMDITEFLNADYSIPFGLTYTYTYGKFRNAFSSDHGAWGEVEEGYELPYMPKNQVNITVGYSRNAVSLNLNGYATSKMRTVAGNGTIQQTESTDSYLLLDASASYQVTQPAQIFVNLRNLTDETYIVSRRPAGVRPGLPRTFMTGIKFEI